MTEIQKLIKQYGGIAKFASLIDYPYPTIRDWCYGTRIPQQPSLPGLIRDALKYRES